VSRAYCDRSERGPARAPRKLTRLQTSGGHTRAVTALEEAGLRSERFEWSVNFQGRSAVSLQLSTEEFYGDSPSRAVPADVHGILLRVAALEDTLRGKIRAWPDSTWRQSKRIRVLADITRLVESHPHLWSALTDGLKQQVQRPATTWREQAGRRGPGDLASCGEVASPRGLATRVPIGGPLPAAA